MKYRLKKDLPFAKAGTEITLHRDNLYYPYFSLERKGDGSLHIWCQGWHTYDSWIEEVEPKEWWLIPNTLPAFEPYAIKGADADISGYKGVIKVREVLE